MAAPDIANGDELYVSTLQKKRKALNPDNLAASGNQIAWYKLDEDYDSATFVDSVNGYDLELGGGAIANFPGIGGRSAVHFVGQSGYLSLVTAGNETAFQLAGDITVVAWAYLEASGSFRIAGSTTASVSVAADRWAWYINKTSIASTAAYGGMYSQWYDNAGALKTFADRMACVDRDWTMIAWRRNFDSGVPESVCDWFVNGIKGPDTTTVAGTPDAGANCLFRVGADASGGTSAIMALQDLMIFDTAISDAAIAAEARRVGAL